MKYKTRWYKSMKLITTIVYGPWRKVFDFLLTQLLIGLVLAYQYLIAPLIADCCRFSPSCATYAKEALIKYGAIKGMRLSIKRLVRCHPWGGSGHDPVV
ncbi:MAG: membrane protein insertion efficiency factor YidD [Bacteroidota bacterium]